MPGLSSFGTARTSNTLPSRTLVGARTRSDGRGTLLDIQQRATHFDLDIATAAQRDTPVLISGGFAEERESLARRLHARGRHAGERFTKVDCLCPQAIEAALADQPSGVVFLDNIDALSTERQSLVCCLLEAGRTCRVVAGTREDLASMLRQGVFSSTLFYRLNLMHLSLPPAERDAEG